MRKEKLEELNELINECKTVKKELLDEKAKFLKFQVYNCTLSNGKTMRREQLIKGSSSNAAIIMPVTNDGNVLLTVEARPMINETVAIGFPAGYVEENEDPIYAASRELLEETGYATNRLIYLTEGHQDNGVGPGLNYLYLAKDIHKVSEPSLDGSEYLKYMFVTLDEAYELSDKGYIKSISNQLLLEKSKKFLRGK